MGILFLELSSVRFDGRNGHIFTWLLCQSSEVYYAKETGGPIRGTMPTVIIIWPGCVLSPQPHMCQPIVPVSRNSVHVASSVRQLVCTVRIYLYYPIFEHLNISQ